VVENGSKNKKSCAWKTAIFEEIEIMTIFEESKK
jgi:hypothetical protein